MRTTAVRSHGGPMSMSKGQLSVARDVLLDGWNLLQVTSASLVLIACLMFLLRMKLFTPIASLASFTMWIELLYFLRAFEFSGGLVRMVFKVGLGSVDCWRCTYWGNKAAAGSGPASQAHAPTFSPTALHFCAGLLLHGSIYAHSSCRVAGLSQLLLRSVPCCAIRIKSAVHGERSLCGHILQNVSGVEVLEGKV